MKIIAFSGTRTLVRYGEPSKQLEILLRSFRRNLFIVHGDASGVDAEVSEWCDLNGVPHAMFFAPWKQGRSAGPLRNKLMRDIAQPTCLYAYPIMGSKGTRSCVSLFRRKGIEVVVEGVQDD